MTRLSSSTKFEILFKFVGIFGGVDVTQHQHIIYRYHTSNIENVEEYMTTESESSTELAEKGYLVEQQHGTRTFPIPDSRNAQKSGEMKYWEIYLFIYIKLCIRRLQANR